MGIEVKASATVSSNDFSGMQKLAEASWHEVYSESSVVVREVISYLAYNGEERGSVSDVKLIGLNDVAAILNE